MWQKSSSSEEIGLSKSGIYSLFISLVIPDQIDASQENTTKAVRHIDFITFPFSKDRLLPFLVAKSL